MAANQQALDLERITSTLGDYTADAIVISDAEPVVGDGPRIIWVNRAFEEMTGYSKDEVIGKTPRILQGPDTDPETRKRIRERLLAWKEIREELKNYRKDGSPFWVDLSIQPVADTQGWFRYWVAIQRETTEQHQLQAQLLQSTKLESMGKMTGGIAHDFNNLLAIVLSNLELMQMQSVVLRDNRLLNNAINAVDKGRTLVHSLLSFARQTELKPEFSDLCELVAEMRDMMTGLLPDRVSLDVVADGPCGMVLIDRHLFQNALINLVINARDAMSDSGAITITTGIPDNAALPFPLPDGVTGYSRVTVADEGSGIPAELIDSVMEPFFTTKSAGEGSGLGLAMVHGFVEQSGGRLWIESEAGKGTRMSLFFPLDEFDRVTRSFKVGIQAQETLDAKVLLVEDDTDLRDALKQILEMSGATVEAAYDARDALKILEHRSDFDILLTDIAMPGELQGPDLADLFLEAGDNRAVVLISGNPRDYGNDPDEGPRHPVLVKPVDAKTLVKTLRRQLE